MPMPSYACLQNDKIALWLIFFRRTQSLHHFQKDCLEAQQSLHGFKYVVWGVMKLHHNRHMGGI
jgi:hypothetical protein